MMPGGSGGPVLKFPGRSVIGYLYFRLVGSRLFKNCFGYFQLLNLNFRLFRLVGSLDGRSVCRRAKADLNTLN